MLRRLPGILAPLATRTPAGRGGLPAGSAVALCCALLLPPAAAAPAPPTPRQYRDFAMRREGSVQRGRELFFAADRGACAQCHTVDGSSGRAGPDLSAVGDTLPRRELVDAILEPSAEIAVGYAATLVVTRSGESHLGVIKEAGADGLALQGVDGRVTRIARAEIASQQASPVSLMPEGVHAAWTLQEFTDVVDYLASLRQPANLLATHHGMPAEIAELAQPVRLRPLLAPGDRFPANPVRSAGQPRIGLVWFGQVPGAGDTFLVGHQGGRIWRLEREGSGWRKALFADFSAEVFCERGPNGLLGLALHPQFQANRRYFVKHQVLEGDRIVTVLAEKRAAPDLRTDSGEPSRVLLRIPSVTQDHSGGCIAFGPDGCLYLAMGDTGPQQDPHGHGQDLGTLLGKILRLDVDRRDPGRPYAVPADNPLRGRAGALPEIWALGFREPWRFSFDAATGDLWVGDVGQHRVEELAIVRRGENHGWNAFEGFEPFSKRWRREGETYVPPVAAYRRQYGNSVTGGYVYRGDPSSSFHGVYVCGDFTSRILFGLTQEGRRLTAFRRIGVAPEGIASFGTDDRGRIYLVGYEGMIFEIDFAAGRFERTPTAPAAAARGSERIP